MEPPLNVSLLMNFVFNEQGDGREKNVFPTLPVLFLFPSRQTSTMLLCTSFVCLTTGRRLPPERPQKAIIGVTIIEVAMETTICQIWALGLNVSCILSQNFSLTMDNGDTVQNYAVYEFI